MSQCNSITKTGQRCKRVSLPARRYCWQHESRIFQNISIAGLLTALLALIGLVADLDSFGIHLISSENLDNTQTPDNGVNTLEEIPTQSIRTAEHALLQSFDVGDVFRDNCINVGFWEPYAYLSTPQYLSGEVPALIPVSYKPGCMDEETQAAWGFYTLDGSLIIKKLQEQDSTIYGLSTPLPNSSLINLKLRISPGSTGGIYFGVLSKRRGNPLSGGETFVVAYPNHNIQLITSGLGTLSSYPFAEDQEYLVTIMVLPERLEINLNNGERIFATEGDFSSRHFMIGYRLANGQHIEAQISELSIQRNH